MGSTQFWIIFHSQDIGPSVLPLVTVLEHVDLVMFATHEQLDRSPDRVEHHFIIKSIDQVVESLSADWLLTKILVSNSGNKGLVVLIVMLQSVIIKE